MFSNGRSKRIAMAAVAGIASVTVATAVGATKDKTFSSGDLSKVVPDEAVAVQTIKVKTKGTIKDVNALVSLDTTINQDYALYLRHPSGETIHLSSNNGGNGDGYGNDGCDTVAFDDEADLAVDSFDGINKTFFGGESYQPEQTDANDFGGLSELDGLKLNGKWQMLASDTDAGGGAVLECFKLEATYKTPKN